MTKNTKMLLAIGGVAVVGYLIWKKYSKKSQSENYSNFSIKGIFHSGSQKCVKTCTPNCSGDCFEENYGKSGELVSLVRKDCNTVATPTPNMPTVQASSPTSIFTTVSGPKKF